MKYTIKDVMWLTVVCCIIATSFYYQRLQLIAVQSLEQTVIEQKNTIYTMRYDAMVLTRLTKELTKDE